MAFERHTGIFESKAAYEQGVSYLREPWVAYVKVGENGEYEIYYSTDPKNSTGKTDSLEDRIKNLEGNKVFLSTSEYETLTGPEKSAEILVMDKDGNIGPDKVRIEFNSQTYYFTYEA